MRRLVACLALALTACGKLLEAPADTDDPNLDGTERLRSSDASALDLPPTRGAAPNAPDAAPETPPLEDPTPDASPAPDAAPSCALVTHHDGLGHTFSSCTPIGVYDEALARAACLAFQKGGASGAYCDVKTSGTCAGKAMVSVGMIGPNGIWDFGGGHPGRVVTVSSGPSLCPTGTDPSWE